MKDQNLIKTVIKMLLNLSLHKIHSLNHVKQICKHLSSFTESDIRIPKASYDNEDFSDFLAKPPYMYEI